MKNSKVAFIHGRPSGHPTHKRYAESVGSEFFFVDFILRWHDIASSAVRRYLSWLLCAIFFPNRKKYDVFFTECIRFPPVVMKTIGLLKKRQKIIALMADESLYFLYTNRYSPTTTKAMKYFFRSCDAIICIGDMQANLAKSVLGERRPPIYTIFNGVPTSRLEKLLEIKPDLPSYVITFIGNGPSGWRGWYKGVDLMLETIELVYRANKEVTLQIVGNWERAYIDGLIGKYCPKSKNCIKFIGVTNDLQAYLANSSMYLHIGRGEAYAISILEAMAGGVVPIISEWTGNKEVVEKIDSKLIVPLNADQIAERILWYFSLPLDVKEKYSNRCKELISSYYYEEHAIEVFQKTFVKALEDINN